MKSSRGDLLATLIIGVEPQPTAVWLEQKRVEFRWRVRGLVHEMTGGPAECQWRSAGALYDFESWESALKLVVNMMFKG